MKWQPIETAPKDGSKIILTNGCCVAEGEYLIQLPYIRENRDMGGHYLGQEEDDGFEGWFDCGGGMDPEPTHWMPLPEPPKEQS